MTITQEAPTVVAEIQAAIDALTAMRGEMPETWEARGRNIVPVSADGLATEPIAENLYSGDVKVITTLHRTIDAQLEILGDGLRVATFHSAIIDKLDGSARIPVTHALLIAKSVNGNKL